MVKVRIYPWSPARATVYVDSCQILGIHPWDINQDGKVDLQDLRILANAHGSTPSSPKWNPLADFNGVGTVNTQDLVLLALHFGQQYP
jgi:hypothetical protein